MEAHIEPGHFAYLQQMIQQQKASASDIAAKHVTFVFVPNPVPCSLVYFFRPSLTYSS